MEDLRVSVDVAAASKAQNNGKNKDRHVVSWSQQEDELLREQVGIHGTENSWTCIAAQFTNKTSRQCRRRWYTHLNTESKKGGWSPEEDMILCEAQKIFGNRWTEISKVVSGRTDNAVKNRFNTLRKKRAKNGFLLKENDNLVNQGAISTLPDGSDSDMAPEYTKKLRLQLSLESKDNQCKNENLSIKEGIRKLRSRSPLAVLSQNSKNVAYFLSNHTSVNVSEAPMDDESNNSIQATLLKRNDSKMSALVQPAELLTCLSEKDNSDDAKQSLLDSWQKLHKNLNQTVEIKPTCSEQSKINPLLCDLNKLEDLSSYVENDRCLDVRQSDLSEDSGGNCRVSAEYSNNSSYVKEEESTNHSVDLHSNCFDGVDATLNFIEVCRSDEVKTNDGSIASQPNPDLKADDGVFVNVPAPNLEFNSPLQTVPLFQAFTEVIPSPKFTASEKQFLMRIIGSPSPSFTAANSDSSEQPSCKRALLHNL